MELVAAPACATASACCRLRHWSLPATRSPIHDDLRSLPAMPALDSRWPEEEDGRAAPATPPLDLLVGEGGGDEVEVGKRGEAVMAARSPTTAQPGAGRRRSLQRLLCQWPGGKRSRGERERGSGGEIKSEKLVPVVFILQILHCGACSLYPFWSMWHVKNVKIYWRTVNGLNVLLLHMLATVGRKEIDGYAGRCCC